MSGEALARIVGEPAQLATTIEFAALRSGDPDAHDAMYVRLYPDRVETPASSPDATQVSFCTARATMYDDLTILADPPVDALFDIGLVLSWLDWLADADGPVTTTFEGDPDTGVAARIVAESADARVTIPCETDWAPTEITLSLPDRFEDGRFLDADGTPVPTTVRTDAAELERLVRATDLASDDEAYDLVVADGDLRLAVEGPDGLVASGTLAADVAGPDVATTVGSGFKSVVSTVVGTVVCQTGPDEPLAICRHHDHYTLRFVVFPEA